MPLTGYARSPLVTSVPRAQTDALCAAGCEKVFVGHASGTLAKRTALEQALGYLRSGDTLVTKLDRLGRSVRNLKVLADEVQARQVGLRALLQGMGITTLGGRLFFHMLAAIDEHDLIVERTVDGLAAARSPGRHGGPKFKMTPNRMAQARSMYYAGQHTVQQFADSCGVSRPTMYRHLGTALPAPRKAAADTMSAEPAGRAQGGPGPAWARRGPVPAQREAS